jgi:AcrR family transcriptional regulator
MSSDVEERVLEATERLLGEGTPYTQLGVSEISTAAGIARSTFYVHFDDKGDLLLRLSRRATEDVRDALHGWWVQREPAATVLLSDGMLRVIDAYRRHAGVLAAVEEVAAYDPAIAGRWRAWIDQYARRLRVRLRAEGVPVAPASEADLDTAAFIVVWSIERTVSEHVRATTPITDLALARSLSQFTSAALLGTTVWAA